MIGEWPKLLHSYYKRSPKKFTVEIIKILGFSRRLHFSAVLRVPTISYRGKLIRFDLKKRNDKSFTAMPLELNMENYI